MEWLYQGTSYPVVLERKRVKNINIRVRTDGTIYVSAPPSVTEARILELLSGDAAKLAEAADRQRNRQADYSDGSVVRYLGEAVRLQWSEKPCKTVLKNGVMTLFARNPEEASYAFRKWSADECVKLCRKWNTEVYQAFQSAGYSVPLARVEIKEMSSRWGSCTAKTGRISINFRLMQYPEGCIRSVFYHEYAHFLHQNHGKDFYAVLRKMVPDYDVWSEILKEGC